MLIKDVRSDGYIFDVFAVPPESMIDSAEGLRPVVALRSTITLIPSTETYDFEIN